MKELIETTVDADRGTVTRAFAINGAIWEMVENYRVEGLVAA